MSRPGIIVAARMTSERFPGKPLALFGATTVIDSCIERCAITGLPTVLAVPFTQYEQFQSDGYPQGAELFEGDELDVLARLTKAAQIHDLDPIIRVTGDCPLTEPGIILAALALWFEKRRLALPDSPVMVSNVHPTRTFAKGLDVEVVERRALDALRADESLTDEEREHVTLGLYRRGAPMVSIFTLVNNGWWATEKSEPLCIDTPEDLERLNRRTS